MKFNINAIVINRTETEKGQLTGGTRRCQMSGCTGICYAVRWNDKKITYPCSKGITVLSENLIKID